MGAWWSTQNLAPCLIIATHGNHNIDVFVNNERIKRVASSKSLGVTLNKNLSWSKHTDNISKKVSSGISAPIYE